MGFDLLTSVFPVEHKSPTDFHFPCPSPEVIAVSPVHLRNSLTAVRLEGLIELVGYIERIRTSTFNIFGNLFYMPYRSV